MRTPFCTHPDDFLIDPHAHTRFSDGLSTPYRMFWFAKKRGLRGLILTDHDTVKHWSASLLSAERLEMATTPGVEISTSQGHLLAYFEIGTSARKVARTLKLDTGNIEYLPVESVIRRVHDLGGLVCVPHPFGAFYPLGIEHMEWVDGVEEYNAWIFRDGTKMKNALGLGKQFQIASLGASDSHYPFTIGFGATAIPNSTDTRRPDWFLHCLRERLTRPVIRQKLIHRQINYLKSTISIPLNMRYNVRFLRSKWRGYWKKRYEAMMSKK